MLRLRARRKLRSILEKVSGLVVLRARRATDLLDKVVALREGAATTASCVICLMLGVGGAMFTPPALTPKASAAPVASSGIFDPSTSNDGLVSGETGAGSTLLERVAEARRAQKAARSGASPGTEKTRPAKSGPATTEHDLLPGVPVGEGDGPGELPQATPAVSAPSAPTVPSDPGDGPVAEPPSPPGLPTPPLPPVGSPPTEALTGEVEELL
jgi:hypothetical protein